MKHRHSQWLTALVLAAFATAPTALAGSREHFEAGDFAEAEAAAQQELDRTPGALGALLVKGQAQLTLGRTSDAVATLRQAAATHANSAEAQYRLGQALTLFVAEAGTWKRLWTAGDIGDAFERAVELEPTNGTYRWALFEFCRHAPAMIGGGLKKAREQARLLAQHDPPRGHRARAALLLQEGKVGAAEKALLSAVETRPGEADHRYALGYFYQEQERWDEAFAQFELIAREFPDELEAQFQIGKTAAASGQRLDEGIRALQRYLHYKPRAGEAPHAWAHYRLGQLHELRQDAAAARTEYQAALRLDPRLADARQALRALAET